MDLRKRREGREPILTTIPSCLLALAMRRMTWRAAAHDVDSGGGLEGRARRELIPYTIQSCALALAMRADAPVRLVQFSYLGTDTQAIPARGAH